ALAGLASSGFSVTYSSSSQLVKPLRRLGRYATNVRTTIPASHSDHWVRDLGRVAAGRRFEVLERALLIGNTLERRGSCRRCGNQELRSAAMRGARRFGLSRLNDRASPSSSRTNASVFATASFSFRCLVHAFQAIDLDSGSYSHSPTMRPRSRIAWLGRSLSPPSVTMVFSASTVRSRSLGSTWLR